MKNFRFRGFLLSLLLAVKGFAVTFDDWPYAMTLKLNTSPSGANIGSSVTNFPILVRLDGGNFDFTQAKSDGSDLRFSREDAEGNLIELPVQVERWDVNAPEGLLWVKVDLINGNDDDQTITMHWGNLFASASAAGPVFSLTNGFQAVYHVNESPGGVSGGYKDASPNGYNATGIGGMPANSPTPGQIGNAQWFDGSVDYLDLPNIPNSGTATVSAWYRMDVTRANAGIVSNGSWTAGTVHFKNNSGTLVANPNSGTTAQKTGQTAATWYYATYTYSKNGPLKLYVNGSLVATGAAPNNDWVGSNLEIGHEYTGYDPGNRYFKGVIDEARVENVVRSDDWVKLCYENQKSSQKLVQFINLAFTSAGGKIYGDIDMNGYTIPDLGLMMTKKWRIVPPDYVFEKGYVLPSLSTVEDYINTNHHLPGVPSALELTREGMDISTFELQLLKQVEHMHLYLIDQDSRLRALEEKKAGKK